MKLKDKIKTQYNRLKQDRFSQGLLVGGAVALGTSIAIGANFDSKNIYIPNHIIDRLVENGPAVAVKNGTLISLAVVDPTN